jgi:hypothetical protein
VEKLFQLREPIHWLEPLLELLATLRQRVLMQPAPTQQPKLIPQEWMLGVVVALVALGEEEVVVVITPQAKLRVAKRHLEKKMGQERKNR